MNYGLSFFLRSKARFAVLRALWMAGRPLHFREIVARECLGIRSVQQEIREMRRLKIIRCVKDPISRRTAYEINRRHEVGGFLSDLIGLEEHRALRARSQDLQPNAVERFSRLSRFCGQLMAMRRKVRGTTRLS